MRVELPATEENVQPASDRPYTNEEMAAHETRWDVYLETGGVKTVHKTVKRIDSIVVLRVAFERADRGLSASTLKERCRIVQRRIRQLKKIETSR